ncbi:type II toxin-antitoxin system HicB family antitoxin [Leucothrix arctica]|uniref:HicB-like antitoxin of toxin-antitoxin system domain-containing protein n=1 Tax=Leucothrix arctica TaxID=1481894 RepID=A0A317CHT0_9GAMM|nr:type II toxin-antitoxin system HicB family antitoxin [Leucothrix arctica]PWQ96963.1 hypothetical protein DKT75_07960 [Leucothrix arctica]
MRYPVVLHKDIDSDFGIAAPDIPGCFSAGSTVDEAINNLREAIDCHLELLAEDGNLAPPASTVDLHISDPDYDNGIWAYVDIDVTPYLGKSEKVNVSLPALLIKQIDGLVSDGKAKSRSAYLAESAVINISTG